MPNPTGKSPRQRSLRVGEEVRHTLAMLFERGELRDPDLAATPLTVTEVRMSPDLRQATIYIMPLGGGQSAAVLAALDRAKGFVRSRLAERVKLRYTPDLTFRFDASFDEANRIAQLLRQPEVARDLAKNPEDGDGD